jgi:hypothetical protein
LLFGALAVIAPLAANVQMVSPRIVLRPLLLFVAIALALLVVLRFRLHRAGKAALVTSLILIFFTLYGHVFRLLAPDPINVSFPVHLGLSLIWGGIALFVICLVIRSKGEFGKANSILNILAFVIIAIQLNDIVRNEVADRDPLSEPLESIIEPIPMYLDIQDPSNLPNIFYIILDTYAGEEILGDIYGLDNSEFISFLRDEGFYVADRSRSNYSQTHLSLASSLNMSYLTVLAEEMGTASTDHKPVDKILRASKVRNILEDLGYTFVSLASGYRRTEILDSDLFLAPEQSAISPFENMLIENSLLLSLQQVPTALGFKPHYPGYRYHRELIEFGFDQLKSLPPTNEPMFVFAHIVSPHPPFVFDRTGNPITQGFPFRLSDGNQYPGSTQEYIEGYREQLLFVNKELMDIVGALKSSSLPPPVIILQGDHGPGAFLDWDSPNDSNHRERMSILNAIYVNELDMSDQLYPDISPVNTFRVIFNSILGTNFELLPDEACFSSWRRPYDFIPVPVENGLILTESICLP